MITDNQKIHLKTELLRLQIMFFSRNFFAFGVVLAVILLMLYPVGIPSLQIVSLMAIMLLIVPSLVLYISFKYQKKFELLEELSKENISYEEVVKKLELETEAEKQRKEILKTAQH